MNQHRFKHLFEETSNLIPDMSVPSVVPAGFVVCPLSLMPGYQNPFQAVQYALYQQALDLAKEMARPSIVERDLFGVWN
jgi:hypothetical protein